MPIPGEVIQKWMVESHLFDPSEEVLFALNKTKEPSNYQLIKPPFENTYLTSNLDIEVDDSIKKSLKVVLNSDHINQHVYEDLSEILESEESEIMLRGLLVHEISGEGFSLERGVPESEILPGDSRKIYINGCWKFEEKYWMSQNVVGVDESSIEVFGVMDEIIKKLVTNFFLFLNQPEVSYKVIERSEKNRRRRLDKGKTPLPDDATIEVTGEIERYLNKLNLEGEREYSHRFWVRGHWRTLRDEEYWGDKAGTKVWVKPHIKGEGPLIEKDYDVKNEQDSEGGAG